MEHRTEPWNEESNQPTANSNVQVNKAIQALAQKYGIDCKNTFEELSRIIQVRQITGAW